MTNEVQRQAYLSALGIENYMPRMILPFAPPSIPCELPLLDEPGVQLAQSTPVAPAYAALLPPDSINALAESPARAQATDILADVGQLKKPVGSINAASILEQLEPKTLPAIAPFALSIWRPVPGFLIIDSRNTALALPTELLLNNLLRCYLPGLKLDLREEVMRWPMIENRFVSRTADDARNELQTWLAVEHELRPVSRLWLMGDNASRYLVAGESSPMDIYWQEHMVGSVTSSATDLTALILPSLIELLQQPLLKARFWASVN